MSSEHKNCSAPGYLADISKTERVRFIIQKTPEIFGRKSNGNVRFNLFNNSYKLDYQIKELNFI